MPDVIYENHLKSAYAVSAEGKRLAITETSFYRLSDETAGLIEELPSDGPRDLFLKRLSELGLYTPEEIFGRLVEIGALTEKRRFGPKTLLKRFLNPRFQIITSRIQESVLSSFGVKLPTRKKRWAAALAWISLAGLLWGSFLALAGVQKAIPTPLMGHPAWIHVFLLALTGGLVHELGHSFAAAAAGIGLRPIGFSVYLIFPVFYTNVSGIETVPLRDKALIDCGGFISQGIFLLLLLLAASLTGNFLFAEAVRWIMVLVFFNLNPFFRTDGYWLYKDLQASFAKNRMTKVVHISYFAAFTAFSGYFLWRLGIGLSGMPDRLAGIANSPDSLFSRGYSTMLWVYFLAMGFVASLRRFQEIRREWKDVRAT
ncbi:MAG TPA: hypothetical protein PK523_01235 [Elusimicrobiales bacterium]|nr:hypothetical protein [Elusimicrobiales bacterium]